MARTTNALVGGIIEVTTGDDLTPFIDVANDLVTEVVEVAKNTDGSAYYSTAQLTRIESWLAAHFYAVMVPRATSERAGPVSETVESKVDLGFDSSKYGQHAKILDRAGGLAALDASSKSGKRRTARIRWAGNVDPDLVTS